MGSVTLDCPRNGAAAVSSGCCEFVNRAEECVKNLCPDRIGVAESRCDSFVAMVQATDLRDLNARISAWSAAPL